MARNRIIYQNEGLFISQATDFLDKSYTSSFTSSADDWLAFTAGNATASYGVSAFGETNLLKLQASSSNTTQRYLKKDLGLSSGKTYKITGKVYIDQLLGSFADPTFLGVYISNNTLTDDNGQAPRSETYIWSSGGGSWGGVGEWHNFSIQFVASGSILYIYAWDQEGRTTSGAVTEDNFVIKDITIIEVPVIQTNLDKVTSISYSYEISRENISALGKARLVDRPINSSPSVNLQIDYLLSSFTNEYLFGFGMTPAGISARFPMLPDEYLNKSGIANEVDRYNDRRNLYLATTKNGLDLQGSVTGDIEGVLCFDNCQLTTYSANFEVDSIPSASVSVVGTDSNYYSKPSMDVPLRNKKTGAVTETLTIDIPTGSDGLTDFKNRAPEVLLAGDISIKIKRSEINDEPDIETPKDIFDLQNDKVQSFSVELPLERSSIDLPGYKINYDKILNFPIMSSINMSVIEDGGQTGILSDFIDKDLEYNVNINIKNKSKSVVLACDFLKVKFDSVSYSHSVGENKVSELSFSSSLDPIDNEQGMFISGEIY